MADFRENRAGIEAMLRSDGVRRALGGAGLRIGVEAERISPVRTGRYKASWQVEEHTFGSDGRPFVRVSNGATNRQDNFVYSLALEFGTRYMRKQRILGRAIDAARIR